MNGLVLIPLLLLSLAGCAWRSTDTPLPPKVGFDMPTVAQGRSLVLTHRCNDCHTRGYLIDGDRIPMDDWLTGESFGWHGPWGISYAGNLRLQVDSMGQEDWIALAKHLKARPLMPRLTLNAMSSDELAAVYQFIRYLGPKGEPAPPGVPAE